MKKGISFSALAATTTIAAVVAPVTSLAATPTTAIQLEEGFYFVNENGQGKFYSMTEWVKLTKAEIANLLHEYGSSDVIIYSEELGVASLSDVENAGKPFNEVAGELKEDSIVGQFVKTDGTVIEVGDVTTELAVESVSAINETSVKVTFSDDAKYDEKSLQGKEITITTKNEEKTTETATYKDGSLLDGEAVFLLSGDSKLVHGTDYTVSAKWATFDKDDFSFNAEQPVVKDALSNKINELAPILFQGVKDNYTAESWKAFEDAVTQAITVRDNAKATQKAVDSALEKLTAAYDGLLNKNVVESAKAVTYLIKDLPAEKDILENGEKILAAQKAYDELSEESKALVTEESVNTLKAATKNFKLFVSGDISGLQEKLVKADTLEAKKAVVNAAKANLEIAKELGISDSEYNFLNDMVVAGEKTIAGEEEAFAKAEAKAVVELIKTLPAEKDILENGEKIVAVQKAYDELSKEAQAFVDGDSVKSLQGTVKNYKLYVNGDISGLQEKLVKADTLEAKKALVEAAKEKLAFAKELGISESEYNFLNEMVVAGEKVIAGEEESVAKAAAKAVVEQINNLPADKVILESGEKIVAVQKAYDELSDEAKAFVEEDSVKSLQGTVKNYKLYVNGDISGLQEKLVKADTLEAKKALVEDAKEKLALAKELGISESEYNFLNDMVVAAEKTVEADEAEIATAIKTAEDAIANLSKEITLDDKPAVEAARKAVKKAQSLKADAVIEGLATLEAAEKTIALQEKAVFDAAIEDAQDTISLIGNPAEFTVKDFVEDEAKVVAAEKKVEDARELGATDDDIVNLDHLKAAREKIDTLREKLTAQQNAVQDVKVALTNLPIAKNITLEHQKQVVEARAVFEAVESKYDLTDKDFLNYWKLTEAEAKIAELNKFYGDAAAKATEVSQQIADLPKEITLADEKAVEAARKAYEALTDTEKSYVTSQDLEKLEAAEAKIADEKAATQVTNLIKAIPTTGDPLESGDEISEAKTAYDKLSEVQKALVSKEDVKTLTSAVSEFITLAKGPASGAVTAVTNEADLTKKQEIVDAAQATLNLAQGLGMEVAEYNHFNGYIAEAQKLVNTAKAQAGKAAVKALNLTWDTDANTTLEAVNKVITSIEGATAAVVGNGVVVTIQFGEATETFKITGAIQLEPTVEDKAAATQVTNLIKAIPTNNNPLNNGDKISEAKTAYDKLSEVQKALVSKEDVKTLTSAVSEFITLAKGPASGAVTAVTNEADLTKKQEIVDAAQATLNLAQGLGMEVAEYNHFNGFIAEAQKLVDKAAAKVITFTSTETISIGDVIIEGEVVGTVASSEATETYVITFTEVAPTKEFEVVIGEVTYTITPSTDDDTTTWTAVKKDDTPQKN